MRRLFILAGLIIILSMDFVYSVDPASIDRLKTDVNYLCSPELAGRDVPGKTGDLTALWIAEQFLTIGLHPAINNDSYLQKVPLTQSYLDPMKTTITLSGYKIDKTTSGHDELTWKWNNGMFVFPRKILSSNGQPDSYSTGVLQAAWCGYGLVAPESNRNDYANAAGKVAFVLPGSDLSPEKAGRWAMIPFKAAAAQRAGAKMLVVFDINDEFIVNTDPTRHLGKDAQTYTDKLKDKVTETSNPIIDLEESGDEFLTVYFDAKTFMDWEEGFWFKDDRSPANIEAFFEKCDSLGGIKVKIDIGYKAIESTHGYNVVGKWNGRNDEYVLLSAHYDHLGTVKESNDNSFYPGADDNASGVAGLLEICRHWKDFDRSGRGLIAVSFAAEEDGLLGSKWFVDNLPVKREKIVAAINIDMIGRNAYSSMRSINNPSIQPDSNYVGVFYSASAPTLADFITAGQAGSDLHIESQAINRFMFGDGDSFNSRHIPTIHIFSGYHADYSSPTDIPEKLNYYKMARVTDFTNSLLKKIAETTEPIHYDPSLKAVTKGMNY